VADNYNHRIQKFSSAGAFVTKWGIADSNDGSAGGRFENPTEVAVDSSGNVYVADNNNYRIQKFIWNPQLGDDGEYEFITKWTINDGGLYGLAVDSQGNVYVTDNANDRIRKYDGTGTLLATWGDSGSCASCIDQPFGVAVSQSGLVYVADLANNRIQVFGEPGPWMTFLGGAGADVYDEANDVVVDDAGNVYVVGASTADWVEADPVRGFGGGTLYDAFAAKLNPDGSLSWYTFLGWTDNDWGQGIDLDAAGNVYVTGRTWTDWEDVTPERDYSGGCDAFVAKLDADTGNLFWHTFLGGAGQDEGWDIAVHGMDSIYVLGRSNNDDWGEDDNALLVSGHTDGIDMLVAALDGSGNLLWYTYLGGTGEDGVYGYCGIAVDEAGNIYAAGSSRSNLGDDPVVPHSGGQTDIFVARLASDGSLDWNTFMGSSDTDSGWDYGNAVAVDVSGDVLVTGQSYVSWGTPLRPLGGGVTNAVVAKLNPSGGLVWYTFLGGNDGAGGASIVADAEGVVYVGGGSYTNWGEPEHAHSGSSNWDVMAAKLSPGGSLLWHTFAGSGGDEGTYGLALSSSGILHIAGYSWNTWGDPIRAYTSWVDGLVLQLVVPASTTVDVDISLATGWNMVSVPVEADDMSVDAVFPDAEAVYTWNPTTKSYETPETIDPKRSYWVAVTSPDTVTVTGTPVTEWTDELTAGWNMVGSVYGDPVDRNDLVVDPPGALQTNAIYHGNPTAKSYDTASQIQQGIGYWMAATQGCELTMTAPGV